MSLKIKGGQYYSLSMRVGQSQKSQKRRMHLAEIRMVPYISILSWSEYIMDNIGVADIRGKKRGHRL